MRLVVVADCDQKRVHIAAAQARKDDPYDDDILDAVEAMSQYIKRTHIEILRPLTRQRPMHNFFLGWRRKAGVVSLVMALAVMVMWIRSLDRTDWFGLSRNHQLLLLVVSSEGEIWWQTTQDPHDPPPFELFWWGSSQHGLVPVLPPIEGDNSRAVPTACVPYWSIATPLTLLSASLILWKPRNLKTTAPPTDLNRR